jgi:hypothetical protein
MPAQVQHGEIPVTNALADLGLSKDILVDAIMQGEAARASCTINDPPCVPGIYSWGSTVRALRDILVPLEWERDDTANYSTVISPDKTFAIAVVTGDAGTGLKDHEPTSKYPKGNRTREAVTTNQRCLFPEIQEAIDEETAKAEAAENRITWMLLKRRSGDSVFSELSLPREISKSGWVQGWVTRIILDPIDVEPMVVLDDDEVSGEAVEVVVRRRS